MLNQIIKKIHFFQIMLTVFTLGIIFYLSSCYQVQKPQNALELDELIFNFINAKEIKNGVEWSWMANSKSPINWQTIGIEENNSFINTSFPYMREGSSEILINGEISHEKLNKTLESGKWHIHLFGTRNSCHQISITSDSNSRDLDPEEILQYLQKKFSLSLVKEIKDDNIQYYEMLHNDLSAKLKFSYSCGSAGCHIAILIK